MGWAQPRGVLPSLNGGKRKRAALRHAIASTGGTGFWAHLFLVVSPKNRGHSLIGQQEANRAPADWRGCCTNPGRAQQRWGRQAACSCCSAPCWACHAERAVLGALCSHVLVRLLHVGGHLLHDLQPAAGQTCGSTVVQQRHWLQFSKEMQYTCTSVITAGCHSLVCPKALEARQDAQLSRGCCTHRLEAGEAVILVAQLALAAVPAAGRIACKDGECEGSWSMDGRQLEGRRLGGQIVRLACTARSSQLQHTTVHRSSAKLSQPAEPRRSLQTAIHPKHNSLRQLTTADPDLGLRLIALQRSRKAGIRKAVKAGKQSEDSWAGVGQTRWQGGRCPD